MARVIKHFEGTGTGTPYTVPTGKIAQIQGSFLFTATGTANVDLTMTMGASRLRCQTYRYGGISWYLSADSSFFLPVGNDQNTLRGLWYTPGSVSSWAQIEIQGQAKLTSQYNVAGTNIDFAYNLPAPRVYMGPGDALAFNQGSGGYLGYNFIAIEEDA